MGQKEGGERAGHRLHNDRICDAATGEKMASICQWCGGWGTSAMSSPEFHA
jgi:hypothetical protein